MGWFSGSITTFADSSPVKYVAVSLKFVVSVARLAEVSQIYDKLLLQTAPSPPEKVSS